MARNGRGLMSPRLKERLAYELGVADIVQQNGGYWGDVPARQCGSLVRAAIELAERQLAQEEQARPAAGVRPAGYGSAPPYAVFTPGGYGPAFEPAVPPTAAFAANPVVTAHPNGFTDHFPY